MVNFALKDLQLKMERFGAVKSCRLVVDKDTKKLKGTAFVDFETTKAAEKAVAACNKDRWMRLSSPERLLPRRMRSCVRLDLSFIGR